MNDEWNPVDTELFNKTSEILKKHKQNKSGDLNMSRIDEIARYQTAEELYSTGMDYLNGTNGKMVLQSYAVKYLKAAADKGNTKAVAALKKLKEQGVDINDSEI